MRGYLHQGLILSAMALGVLAPGLAQAADLAPDIVETAPQPVAPQNDWRFQATFYGWFSGLDGDVGVYGFGPASISVSPIDAIKDLDGALMGSFGGTYDKFMFLTDFMWTQISQDGNIRDTGLGFDYSQTQITIQGLVGYQLPLGVTNLELSATAGFRYQNLSADFSVGPNALPISIGDSGTKQWIDPTVGLYAHYDFNDRWFVNALGDVGGFGVGSNFTWQAFGALGYNWSKTVSTSIGYRAIYEDYEDGGFVYDTTQQGVFAGVGIHF